MVRQPLIQFRHAIQKAAAAGLKTSKVAANVPTPPTVPVVKRIPAPPGVVRTSQRIEKPIPRAILTDEEMEAIMLGGAS